MSTGYADSLNSDLRKKEDHDAALVEAETERNTRVAERAADLLTTRAGVLDVLLEGSGECLDAIADEIVHLVVNARTIREAHRHGADVGCQFAAANAFSVRAKRLVKALEAAADDFAEWTVS
ncbi:MAG: hypothetical protein KGL39_42995 [Patescibacteria group bacterium]|nr:hypothetical protein [Patescibacteria group bacterium]